MIYIISTLTIVILISFAIYIRTNGDVSLKKLLTTSYGEKIYKYAVDLQKMKVKANMTKNQLILLERCIKSNIISLKPPIKASKPYKII